MPVGMGSISSSSSSSSSGCSGPRNDGIVFVSTNATVSIEICGESYLVPAGIGGGLAYSYHAGLVNFTAPSSVNGSAFEFWYVMVGSSPPQRLSNATLSLNLPAGLSQNSLIELFFAAPPTPARSSTVAANTTTSSTFSTTSATTVSSTASGSSVITSTTSVTNTLTESTTTNAFCLGNDGSIFLSTNINATVSIDVCGNPAQVSGGIGGGFNFNYHAGNATFIAPATAGGKAFQYWYVLLPSQQEKVTSTQMTIDLPAGYSSSNSIIEAFYG